MVYLAKSNHVQGKNYSKQQLPPWDWRYRH